MRPTLSRAGSGRLLAVWLVLALVVTACGSRLGDDQRAIATGGSGARPGAAVAGPGAHGLEPGSADLALDDLADLDDLDAIDPDPPGAGDAGPADPGAGTPAEGDGGGPDGAAPVEDDGAAAATRSGPAECRPSGGGAPGVSADEVRVGNVSTMSGPIPGFGQTGVAGVRAYFNMVNATGGVCGRKLTLVTGDDRLQAAANRSETEKLSDQVLAFVGSTTVTDDGGTPIIEAKEIPDVSLSVADARVRSPYNFSPNPVSLEPGNGTDRIFAHLKSTRGVSRAAIIYPEQATARQRALDYADDFAKAGIEVVEMFSVPVTETRFTSQVNRMRNQDVDIVVTTLEVNGMARLAKEFEQAGWFPEVPFYGAQVYGQKFVQLAGPAADRTIVGLGYAIVEDARSPGVAALAEWYPRSNPGLDLDFFGLMGWAAADMFVTALRAAGPDPDRASVLAGLRQLSPYEGDGLLGRIDPVNKKPPACFMIATVERGRWTREFPAQGFQC